MSQENVGRVREGVDAFVRGEWGRVAAIYDPEAVVRPDPRWPEQTISGRDAVIVWFKSTAEVWGPDVEEEEIRDLGDRVLARYCWKMRGARSGIEGEMRWSQISTFHNARVIRLDLFIDHEEALKAVGLED